MIITCVVVLAAVVPAVTGSQPGVTRVAAYLVLMVLPGLAIHCALDREPGTRELVLSALVMSPIVVAALATLLILAGMSAASAASWIVAGWGLAGIAGVAMVRGVNIGWLGRRHALILTLTLAVFCALSACLPLTREWWRYYSDAWFHQALVPQIDTYGLPPEDPSFAGFTVQYMWLYHVLILVLAKATGTDAGIVMAIVAAQALAGFGVAAYALSLHFRKRFAYGWFAVITVVLALNALCWLFLPLELVRALTGDVRGWQEITRILTPLPFDVDAVFRILRVYYNRTFFLNKFIVLTPFSLGLMYMAAYWYGSTRWLADGQRTAIVLVLLAAIGMLGFHPPVGFFMLAATFASVFIIYLYRRHLGGFSAGRTARLAGTVLVALLVASPYLYSVMHLKQSEHLIPASLTVQKFAAIIISCALVLVLAGIQLRRLVAERSVAVYFVIAMTLSLFVAGNLIDLPGPNKYDKPAFLIFYPLAIIGSWTFADRFTRRHATVRRRARVIVIALLLLLPVNVFALAAFYNTPPRARLTRVEREVAVWVRESTPRDALFIDSGERIFLLVPGHRRYFWGREAYANLMGYPRDEVDRRRHVRDALYSSAPLDHRTLAALGAIESDLYLIVRDGEQGVAGLARFEGYPDLFEVAHTVDSVSVVRVNRQACRELALKLAEGNR